MARSAMHCLLLAGLLVAGARAFTQPDQAATLLAFRDEMFTRPGYRWEQALENWKCPTPVNQSTAGQTCDPCGNGFDWWGNFDHISCRDGWVDGRGGDGYVTNVHITDYSIPGTVPAKQLCGLTHLKEFDMDGGELTGSIPIELSTCFERLEEIDLSYNNLTGTIPAWLSSKKALHSFKVEHNDLEGSIPDEVGQMPVIQWLRFSNNPRLGGKIPDSVADITPHLAQFTVDDTEIEGTLYPLSEANLINAGTANTNLCGMVPIGVRFAHSFNYYGTQLGLPCPDEIVDGWTDLSEGV